MTDTAKQHQKVTTKTIYSKLYNMNYKRHYDLMMQKAKIRLLDKGVYVENHHIVPKSEGGSDEPSNLVKLTAREHFVAHWLLFRENPKIDSRAYSFWRMCNGRGKVKVSDWIVIPSRAYEEARCAHSTAISSALKGRKKSKEHVEKVAAANRGKKRSNEAKVRMSLAKVGKQLTQEHKNNMKGRVPWNKGQTASSQVSTKISVALVGNTNAAKACSIEGRVYPSAKEAAKQEGIPLNTLKNRIRNKNKPQYFYIKKACK